MDKRLTVDEARDFIVGAATRIAEFESVATLDALGRVLVTDQTSTIDVPPADNSQMDGYAVRAADCVLASAGAGVTLKVSQRIRAGVVGAPLALGTAARIFTGATVPEGADAIVMQEQTTAEKTDAGEFVTLQHAPQPGEWVRRAGEDIRRGGGVLSAGTRLRAQELGLAASVGLATLPVVRRPRVAVFFTGDELAMPGEVAADELVPGAIFNSNRFVLRALLEGLGCQIADLGIVPDTLDATRDALRRAAAGHDLVVTSGGVSVGEEDHVKAAVEAEGALDLWQIAMKPGKPLAFGRIRSSREAGMQSMNGSEALFLGLPGNPVSSFVTFLLFARPLLLRMQGVREVAPRVYPMRADFDWNKTDRRQEYLRARVNSSGGLDLYPNQGSAVLTSTVWGDGLVENPVGNAIARGDIVRFLPYSELV